MPAARLIVFAVLTALAAACSTPPTGGGAGYADATEDGSNYQFDAKTFQGGADAHDAGKTDVPKADVADAGAPKADGAKTDTNHPDVDAAAPDLAGADAADVAPGDEAAPGDDADAVADAADDAGDDVTIGADTADVSSDDVGMVKSPFVHLCDPCSATEACNEAGSLDNLCISSGSDGSFCGIACDPSDTTGCPDYYSCQAVTGGTSQCQPSNGMCTCSLAAAIAQLSTPCSVSNTLGTCLGTRSCGVKGLGKCTAQAAVNEVCNGVDDNCDGKTDEGLCTGNGCLAGTCDAVTGVCAPAPNGTTCNDSNNCTTTDGCSFGTCTGTSPDDGNGIAPGTAIAKKSDCDGTSKTTSILAPGSDVDWFNFAASDDTFCSIYPSARVDQMAGDYDLCMYFACKNGKSSSSVVGCNQGNKVSGGPNGMWGCCSANAGLGAEKVELNTTCSTLGAGDDGGSLWIEVTAHAPKTANICGGYTLTWAASSF